MANRDGRSRVSRVLGAVGGFCRDVGPFTDMYGFMTGCTPIWRLPRQNELSAPVEPPTDAPASAFEPDRRGGYGSSG